MELKELEGWAQCPPSHDGEPYRRIVRPAGASPLVGWVVSRWYWGGPVHFWQGHDFPHLKTASRCPVCIATREGTPVRWKGYLEVWRGGRDPLCLYELTSESIRGNLDFAPGAPELRGRKILVARHGNKKNGRIQARLEEGIDPAKLPVPVNLAALLMKIWLASGFPLGVEPQEVPGE